MRYFVQIAGGMFRLFLSQLWVLYKEIKVNRVKIILLRSQDIISDSRVLRYEKWFKDTNISYKIVGWDRELKGIERENTVYFRHKTGFQQRIGGIKNRIKWNWFLLKYLFKNYRAYKIIHACDFDTVLPALILRLVGKTVIFDIFDWFSDEVATGNYVIDSTINFLEKCAVRFANLVIICEKGRIRQMAILPNNYIVIPNIPTYSRFESNNKKERELSSLLHIAYVGSIVQDRGLSELLKVVSDLSNITLCIAGFGDDEIVEQIIDYTEHYHNITYHGKVTYDKAIEIMKDADLIYAMYYKKIKIIYMQHQISFMRLYF